MSIPTALLEHDFQKFIEPYLSKAKRGYVSTIPLYKIFMNNLRQSIPRKFTESP